MQQLENLKILQEAGSLAKIDVRFKDHIKASSGLVIEIINNRVFRQILFIAKDSAGEKRS